jgi:hypothetical protein
MKAFRTATLAALIAAGLALPAAADDVGQLDPATVAQAFKKPGYSPYAGRNFPSRPLFGDTHLHTAISLDAGAVGASVGPETAYRFARGEEVTTSTGQQAKLSRPLDFLVVSDHAEAFGSMVAIVKGNPTLLADPQIKQWSDQIHAGGETAVKAAWEIIGALAANTLPKPMTDAAFIRSVWEPYIKIADHFNEPGKFTAFIGYEWSSMPDGDNAAKGRSYGCQVIT